MKPEEEARKKIDDLLSLAGWNIQDYKDLNLGAIQGLTQFREDREARLN